MRIFVRKKEEVTGGWRELCKEFYNLCSAPNIIRVMKSRRIRRTGRVTGIGEMRNTYVLFESLKEGDYFGDLDIDGRIQLK
jgi:hypothetical protein